MKELSQPLNINYYISGHGYGHATRSSQIISALLSLSPTTTITILTTAPAHLFPTSPRLQLIPLAIDSTICQPQPYTISASSSFTSLLNFLKSPTLPALQSHAADILDLTKCNLILADAPYPIAFNAAAQERGIRSILISNFSFDAIFERLLTYLPEQEREQESTKHVMESLGKLYATYKFLLRLPGYISFPFVETYWSVEERKARVFDTPLVFRPPIYRDRGIVMGALGVPPGEWGKKVLLMQFGGQVFLGAEGESKVPNLPEGWICLCANEVKDERFFTFPSDVYSPDLVEVADAVLGKIGYGTVSECVGMRKALLYVLRPMFAEEPGLLKYMAEYGVCEEISVEDFEGGNWAGAIQSVTRKKEGRAFEYVQEGSAEVARVIENLVAC